jgi:hypothetical protein
MGTTACLRESVQHTYDDLHGRLEAACEVTAAGDHSRRGCPPIDMLSACVAQHLHAVDEVLLPCLPMHRDTHDFRAAQHEVEVVLAHVKAHEFGSTYEHTFSWSAMWSDVRDAMTALQHEEEALVARLYEMLDDEELVKMTAELARREPREPTRPHPYLPHTGAAGQAMRRVMRVVDGFWDEADGRYVPVAPRAPRKAPGRLAQYLMGNPRFDDEE